MELPQVFLARALDGPRSGEPASPLPSPLYTLLIGKPDLVKDGPQPARRTQLIILGGLLPFLAALAAGRAFGRRAGMVAGVIALLTAPLWIHLTWILPTGWQAAAGLAFLALVARPPGSTPASRSGTGLI